MKIRKFVKQQNVAQLPKSVQDIIRDQQNEATRYEQSAMEDLKQAHCQCGLLCGWRAY